MNLDLYTSEVIDGGFIGVRLSAFNLFESIVNALFGDVEAQTKNDDTGNDYFIEEFHIQYRRQIF